MKEKFFKDLGLDDDNGKMKKLENQYNLDDLFEKKEEKKEAHQKDTANCHWLSRYLIPKPGLQDRTDSDES